jgi:hypothetical protein
MVVLGHWNSRMVVLQDSTLRHSLSPGLFEDKQRFRTLGTHLCVQASDVDFVLECATYFQCFMFALLFSSQHFHVSASCVSDACELNVKLNESNIMQKELNAHCIVTKIIFVPTIDAASNTFWQWSSTHDVHACCTQLCFPRSLFPRACAFLFVVMTALIKNSAM